jgi:hypothetical protein
VADVHALDPRLIWHVQLCDGTAEVSPQGASYDASYERLYPGGRRVPFVDLFRDAPTDISWGIEAPIVRRAPCRGTWTRKSARADALQNVTPADSGPGSNRCV